MSLDELMAALDALDEPSTHEGAIELEEPLAIALPDGDVGALADPGFVAWLLEHGEPAPFGLRNRTLFDPGVRTATRLVARGAAQVIGFDPALILDDIERALSPAQQLTARLTDVLVYPPGGHFLTHRDTPRSPEMLGTLVVGLPIPHEGGAFTVADRDTTHVFDWSGPANPRWLRWVALFSDAEHAVQRVTAGARVTLVYELSLSDRPRRDGSWQQRLARVHAAARGLTLEGPLLIGCARHVIGLDRPQPQGLEVLRGVDRDVAMALVRAGLTVTVRTCLVGRGSDYDLGDDPLPGTFRHRDPVIGRLGQPISDEEIDRMLACLTFETPWGADGGGLLDETEVSSLAPYLIGPRDPLWLMRRNAAVTFLRAAEIANDGFIGNGADDGYLYKLAALEVTRP